MVTEGFERVARKLGQHERKLECCVETWLIGVRVRCWRTWESFGRMRVLELARPGGVNLSACRRLAKALFGADWIRAAASEWIGDHDPAYGSARCVRYGLPLDGAYAVRAGLLEDVRPAWFVQRFEARVLMAGIGEHGQAAIGSGRWHGPGTRMERWED